GWEVGGGEVGARLAGGGLPWKCTGTDLQTVSIEAPVPVPHMPELLALAKFAIVKRQSDGTLLGTGPYKLSEWRPGERALLIVNEDHWEGRAYSDAIGGQMGGSVRERLLERQFGGFAAGGVGVGERRCRGRARQGL